jgi:hypothetical protein
MVLEFFFFLIYVLIRYPELNVIFFLWNEFNIFVIILAVGICNQFVSARDWKFVAKLIIKGVYYLWDYYFNVIS